MWPLLVCSIAALAVVLERLLTLHRARTHTRRFMNRLLSALREKGVDEAVDICTHTRGPVAAVLHSGLLKAGDGPLAVEKAIETAGVLEMSFLQRGLIVLASVTTVAPLLGFLGTVSGMIHAFDAIATAEQVTAQLVASGVREALITTAAGLMIAIPAQVFYHYFLTRIDRFVIEMEEASVELVDALSERRAPARG
jgi:biopolymer transport protein ExbB